MQIEFSQGKYFIDIVQIYVSRRSYRGLALVQSDGLKPILQFLGSDR